MSVIYTIHTEVFIDGKWHLADPLVLNKDGGYKQTDTYWGYGACLNDAWEKMKELGKFVRPEELSKELYKHLSLPDDDFPREFLAVPIESLKINSFANEGYVSKQAKKDFLSGEIDELWPVTLSDIAEDNKEAEILASLFDRFYEWHEWDNPFDWQYQFKLIEEKAQKRICELADVNNIFEKLAARIICWEG